MRKLLYALRFLTVLPIPWRRDERLSDVARSAALFPMVGVFVAIAVWGAGFVFSLGFGLVVRRVAAVIAWIAVTGGLHLDGLADTADGALGGSSPEKRLEIMKDSRIGTFGVLAVVSVVLLKLGFLVEIPSPRLPGALLLAATVSRVCQVMLIIVFPSARPDGLGAFFKEHLKPADLVGAVLLGIVLAWLAGGVRAVVVAVGAVALALLLGWWFARRLGGLSGDVYGGTSEILEAGILGAAVVVPVSSVLERLPSW
jgi:adenosylcobinamide-GDP ribazoletransferase